MADTSGCLSNLCLKQCFPDCLTQDCPGGNCCLNCLRLSCVCETGKLGDLSICNKGRTCLGDNGCYGGCINVNNGGCTIPSPANNNCNNATCDNPGSCAPDCCTTCMKNCDKNDGGDACVARCYNDASCCRAPHAIAARCNAICIGRRRTTIDGCPTCYSGATYYPGGYYCCGGSTGASCGGYFAGTTCACRIHDINPLRIANDCIAYDGGCGYLNSIEFDGDCGCFVCGK